MRCRFSDFRVQTPKIPGDMMRSLMRDNQRNLIGVAGTFNQRGGKRQPWSPAPVHRLKRIWGTTGALIDYNLKVAVLANSLLRQSFSATGMIRFTANAKSLAACWRDTGTGATAPLFAAQPARTTVIHKNAQRILGPANRYKFLKNTDCYAIKLLKIVLKVNASESDPMFTIEHDYDASVVTLVDEGKAPLREDVIVNAFDDCVTVTQFDPRIDDVVRITLSLSQLRDLEAALDLPEGIYQLRKP